MASISLDFRRDNSAEQRPYFVIGSTSASIQALMQQYGVNHMEPVDVSKNNYRRDLGLAPNFQGIAILIQDHVAGDLDHTQGVDSGSNIYRLYNKIQRIQPLTLNQHGQFELNQVQRELERLGEAATAVMPQFGELNQLIGAVKPQIDDRKVAEHFQRENQPAIQQTQEQILSLEFLLQDPSLANQHDSIRKEIGNLKAQLAPFGKKETKSNLCLKVTAALTVAAAILGTYFSRYTQTT